MSARNALQLRAVAASHTPGYYPTEWWRGALDQRRPSTAWKRVWRCNDRHATIEEAEACARREKNLREQAQGRLLRGSDAPSVVTIHTLDPQQDRMEEHLIAALLQNKNRG